MSSVFVRICDVAGVTIYIKPLRIIKLLKGMKVLAVVKEEVRANS
jgi:hypothetical protein